MQRWFVCTELVKHTLYTTIPRVFTWATAQHHPMFDQINPDNVVTKFVSPKQQHMIVTTHTYEHTHTQMSAYGPSS